MKNNYARQCYYCSNELSGFNLTFDFHIQNRFTLCILLVNLL